MIGKKHLAGLSETVTDTSDMTHHRSVSVTASALIRRLPPGG